MYLPYAPLNMVSLLVNVPRGFSDDERMKRFEAPLRAALGKGARISAFTVHDFGGKPVACNFSLEVPNLEGALPLLRKVLAAQSAPKGSSVVRLDTSQTVLAL